MNVYIALGSNLQQPLLQLEQAVEQIKNHADLTILQLSSFYQSKALLQPGSSAQADYINAVLLVESDLSAQDLLIVLQSIETKQGRTRGEKWSPRTLDLDILLYGDKIIQTENLIIPHPEMCTRNFVLYPLAEISSAIEIPEKGLVTDLLNTLTSDGLTMLQA